MSQPIWCLMGPTGVGKTALAIALAKDFPIEVISVDSAMVYRGMAIGTAKPSMAERGGVKHHLIDCCAPDEAYSVGSFCEQVPVLINEIQQRGNMPVLVGGTMMYYHALQQGLAKMPDIPQAVKAQVDQMIQSSLPDAYQQLTQQDPELAKRLHPNDKQRIARGLEVVIASGKPLSEWQRVQRPNLYHWKNIAVVPADREQHRQLLATRFNAMLTQGFEAEVRDLLQHFPTAVTKPSMRSVGYQQMIQYIHAQIAYDEMQRKAIVATCRLAKRQLTWLRSWPNVTLIRKGCDTVYSKVLCALQ